MALRFSAPRRQLLPGLAISLALSLGVGLLGSCQNRRAQQAERERQEQEQLQQAARQRQLDGVVRQCQAGQEELQRLADELADSEAALSRLAQRRYSPNPRPPAPDPELQQRYTIADQELELERHQEAVQAWEQQERQRRSRWQAELERERLQLKRRLAQQREALAQHNPAVLQLDGGEGLNAPMLATYLSCDREALAKLAP